MGKSLYEITEDMRAIFRLVDSAVDEEGAPRELNEEEVKIIEEWFTCTKEDFENKADSYCKLIKNFKIRAENIDSERKIYKAELDRLANRSKVAANTADRMQRMLQGSMEILGIPKLKTELFSLNIQNTQLSVKPYVGDDLSKVPEKYLKPRELDTVAIKQAIKDGFLTVGTEGLDAGKIFDLEGNRIEGIYAQKGSTLVIR